jgi:hypothetical protein
VAVVYHLNWLPPAPFAVKATAVEFIQYNTGEGAVGAVGVGFTYTVPVAAIWQDVLPSVTVTV